MGAVPARRPARPSASGRRTRRRSRSSARSTTGTRPATRWPATTRARPRPGPRTSPRRSPATSTASSSGRPTGELNRIDPRARRLTNSVGNGVIYDAGRPSTGATPSSASRRGTTSSIYELHVGTFSGGHARPAGHARRRPQAPAVPPRPRRRRDPADAAVRVRRRPIVGLQPGVPVRGRERLRLARTTSRRSSATPTQHGIAVILDVVYNHLGPSDLDLWQFDGWSENGKGGIYFYEDDRSTTPWGETRPDYGRSEVRDVPPRQRDPVARRVPGRRPALGRDGLHLEHHGRRQRRAGPDRGRLALHGRHQRRDRRALSRAG